MDVVHAMTLVDKDGTLHFVHDGETEAIAAMLDRGCYVQKRDGTNRHPEVERHHQETTGEPGQGNPGDSVQHRTEGESQLHEIAVGGHGSVAGVDLHPNVTGELRQRAGNNGSTGTTRKSRSKSAKGNTTDRA